MGTVRLFRVQQSKKQDRTKQNTHQSSPQASCLSSLRWQQTAPAFAIFLVKAISSGEVSWGAFFVYATRKTWKKHFPPNLAEFFTCFLDPHAFSKTLLHQKAWIQLIYFIHMVPGPVLGTHSLWHSIPFTLVTSTDPNGKINTGQQADSIPTFKSFLEMNFDLWCFNFYDRRGISAKIRMVWATQSQTLEAIFTSHLLFLKRGAWGRPPAGTGNWVLTVEPVACPWGRKNSDMTERLSTPVQLGDEISIAMGG